MSRGSSHPSTPAVGPIASLHGGTPLTSFQLAEAEAAWTRSMERASSQAEKQTATVARRQQQHHHAQQHQTVNGVPYSPQMVASPSAESHHARTPSPNFLTHNNPQHTAVRVHLPQSSPSGSPSSLAVGATRTHGLASAHSAVASVSSSAGGEAKAVAAYPASPSMGSIKDPVLSRTVVRVTDWKPYDRSRRTEVVAPISAAEVHARASSGSSYSTEVETSISGRDSGRPGDTNGPHALRRSLSSSSKGGEGGEGAHGGGSGSGSGNGSTGGKAASHGSSSRSKDALLRIAQFSFEPCWRDFVLRSPRWRRLVRLMYSNIYLCANAVLTLFSLFARDFSVAFLPKAADTPIAIMLCVVFFLFVMEILLNVALRRTRNYLLTFLCGLDVIGTASLAFDLTILWNGTDGNGEWQGMYGDQPGASGQLHRSVSILRVARFARLFRVLRLVRVLKIFRFSGQSAATAQKTKLRPGAPPADHVSSHAGRDSGTSGAEGDVTGWSGAGAPDHHAHHQQSGRIGLHLSELIDKRVISMLLVLLILVPLLQPDIEMDRSASLGLDLLDSVTDPTSFQAVVSTIKAYGGSDLQQFWCMAPGDAPSGPGSMYVDALDSSLRRSEVEQFSSSKCSLLLSVRPYFWSEAGFNMLLTLSIMLVFGIGSYSISKDVHTIIVAPLERMTGVIKRLAGTVLFLDPHLTDEEGFGFANREGSGQDGSNGFGGFDGGSSPDGLPSSGSSPGGVSLIPGYETHVIEAIIEKLSHIFQVQPDASSFGSGGSHGAKGLAMLAGSKSTEIRTADSIVSIDVVERPRAPQVSMADLAQHDDGTYIELDDPELLGLGGSGGGDASVGSEGFFKELSSVESILSHPVCCAHFKLYLQHAFLVENLTFVTEVDRFKAILRAHASRLWAAFVGTKAASQINIPSSLRAEIGAQVDAPNYYSFDKAQAECMMLMRSHYKLFLHSRFAQGYAKAKLRQRGRRAGSAAPKLRAAASMTGTTTPNTGVRHLTAIKVVPSSGSNASAIGGGGRQNHSAPSTTPPSPSGAVSPGGGDVPVIAAPPHPFTHAGARLLGVPSSASRCASGGTAAPSRPRSTSASGRRYIPGQTEAEMTQQAAASNGTGSAKSSARGARSSGRGLPYAPSPSLPGTADEGTGNGSGAAGGPTAFDELDLESRNLTRPGWESEALVNPVAFHREVGSSASLLRASTPQPQQPAAPVTPTAATATFAAATKGVATSSPLLASLSGPPVPLSRIVITQHDADVAGSPPQPVSPSLTPTAAEPSNIALIQSTPVLGASSNPVSAFPSPLPSARMLGPSKASSSATGTGGMIPLSPLEAESLGAELTVDEFRLMYPNQPVPEAARRNSAKAEAAEASKRASRDKGLVSPPAPALGHHASMSSQSSRLGVPNSGAVSARPPRTPQLSASELEAESLRFMLPGASKTGAATTGDRDLDDEIDRLVNPGAEVAKLLSPGAGSAKNSARGGAVSKPATVSPAATAKKRAPVSPAPSSTTAASSVGGSTDSNSSKAAARKARASQGAAAGKAMMEAARSASPASPSPAVATGFAAPASAAKRGTGRASAVGAAIMNQ